MTRDMISVIWTFHIHLIAFHGTGKRLDKESQEQSPMIKEIEMRKSDFSVNPPGLLID
jgi:hypothetical protein